MAEIISLSARRAARARRDAEREGARGLGAAPSPAVFVFDPVCPLSYLGLERIERLFPRADWQVGDARLLRPADPDVRARAERRAEALRIPLVWPERSDDGTPARRAAAAALRTRRGGAFVLALARLTFCGGYDPDDLETLLEAAAAAGLPAPWVHYAVDDSGLDRAAQDAALAARTGGAAELPALRLGQRAFGGEERLAEALAAAAARAG